MSRLKDLASGISASKIDVINFPPIPAITTPSTSPGFITLSPDPKRVSMRSSKLYFEIVALAASSGPTPTSAAMALFNCPLNSPAQGK